MSVQSVTFHPFQKVEQSDTTLEPGRRRALPTSVPPSGDGPKPGAGSMRYSRPEGILPPCLLPSPEPTGHPGSAGWLNVDVTRMRPPTTETVSSTTTMAPTNLERGSKDNCCWCRPHQNPRCSWAQAAGQEARAEKQAWNRDRTEKAEGGTRSMARNSFFLAQTICFGVPFPEVLEVRETASLNEDRKGWLW